MSSSSALDLAVTATLVAGAIAWLVWNLTARERKPACHVVAGSSHAPSDGGGGAVILGDGLARGLAAARAKRVAVDAQK